ncbi:hypothetical protein OUZ56_019193 [Daphnia magna]|uniref:Uncharacterized protein n=1 Tax=Daphnia magna TaxID=35525 RepID=A0ABQ9ZAY4_9CRUS|nr:hypothetical protein OUZ56_019193 [Daphnia magna]
MSHGQEFHCFNARSTVDLIAWPTKEQVEQAEQLNFNSTFQRDGAICWRFRFTTTAVIQKSYQEIHAKNSNNNNKNQNARNKKDIGKINNKEETRNIREDRNQHSRRGNVFSPFVCLLDSRDMIQKN